MVRRSNHDKAPVWESIAGFVGELNSACRDEALAHALLVPALSQLLKMTRNTETNEIALTPYLKQLLDLKAALLPASRPARLNIRCSCSCLLSSTCNF